MFMSCHYLPGYPFSKYSADIFRNAAMNLKVALVPFADVPVFGIPNYEQQ
jgi:hypothetical protein